MWFLWIVRRVGFCMWHFGMTLGQREAKGQPLALAKRLGTSPESTTRERFLSTLGSGIGIAERSACV